MIVLIGSLISTVVVSFTMIMRTLEEFCRISTNEPNKYVSGDSISSASRIEPKATASIEMTASATAASSISAKASTQYVDFDKDATGEVDHQGVLDAGGLAMGALPFHGNVVIQSSECAIEMQRVSNWQSNPVSSISCDARGSTASLSSVHQNQSAIDRDSQVMDMLADIQRRMHEQATRSEAQLAFLTSQMARSEMQVAALVSNHAALKADLEHTLQLQDHKIQHVLGAISVSDRAVDS